MRPSAHRSRLVDSADPSSLEKACCGLATLAFTKLLQSRDTAHQYIDGNRNACARRWGTGWVRETGRMSQGRRKLERETGFEPATSTLARSHSTTELFPLAACYRNTSWAQLSAVS